MRITSEGDEASTELFARGRLNDDLPGVAAVGAFVEGGHRGRDGEFGVLVELLVSLLDFGEGGFFGFIGDAEASEVGEGWHLLLAATLEDIIREFGKIGVDGGLNNGMIGLIGLDNDLSA